jgi:hypothetical protein
VRLQQAASWRASRWQERCSLRADFATTTESLGAARGHTKRAVQGRNLRAGTSDCGLRRRSMFAGGPCANWAVVQCSHAASVHEGRTLREASASVGRPALRVYRIPSRNLRRGAASFGGHVLADVGEADIGEGMGGHVPADVGEADILEGMGGHRRHWRKGWAAPPARGTSAAERLRSGAAPRAHSTALARGRSVAPRAGVVSGAA